MTILHIFPTFFTPQLHFTSPRQPEALDGYLTQFQVLKHTPCLGRASASLRKLVRLSAPSWLRIEGSISVSCLVSAWPVMVKVLAANDACTLGLLKWITVPWFVNMFTCKAIFIASSEDAEVNKYKVFSRIRRRYLLNTRDVVYSQLFQ